MQARFVSLAIGYAIAGGVLRRKGARRRPWLELRRSETESTYLGHQVQALRSAAEGGFTATVDMVPGDGFYDLVRARVHAPGLERAMELLCPEDAQALNQEALAAAGLRGLACAWLDAGRWDHSAGVWSFRSGADAREVKRYLQELGIRPSLTQPMSPLVRVPPDAMAALVRLLRPHVHRSMRHALRPGSLHGAELAARGRPGRIP